MNIASKLGRPLRLGLVSVGAPAEYADHLRRSCTMSEDSGKITDNTASATLQAVDKRILHWIGFNVCVGEETLKGKRYHGAVRWLLDAGVDAIVCTAPIQEEELRVVGVNRHAHTLGVPVIVADSEQHVDKASWAHGVVMASADDKLGADEAVWEIEPERCRVGGRGNSNAEAAGVVAGVALSELARSQPRSELLDSLRAWTLLASPWLAS